MKRLISLSFVLFLFLGQNLFAAQTALDTVTDPTLHGEETTIQGDDVRLTMESNAVKQQAMNTELYGQVATHESTYDHDAFLTSEVDGSVTNEIQTIDVSSLSGTTLQLSLSSDGEATKTIDLSPLQDGTGTDDQTAVEVSIADLDEIFTATNVETALAENRALINSFSGVSASDVLTKTNTTSYTPSADYHPSTKKYVDDSMAAAGAGDITAVVAGTGLSGGGDTGSVTLNIDLTAGTGITISDGEVSVTADTYDAAGSAATVQGNLDSHTGSTGNVHSVSASQISSSAVSTTAATNVDAAITELTNEKVNTSAIGTAAARNAEDTLTDGANLPDGAAIIAYGDANWGGGSMTYPGAGIPLSTGSAWGTSYSLTTLAAALDGEAWTFTGAVDMSGASSVLMGPISFEGATADEYETTFSITDPTADRTITVLNVNSTIPAATSVDSSGKILTAGLADADLATWAGVTPGTGVATFLGTPSTTNFFSALTGEGAFAATLFGYADAAAVLSGIGAQAADADLTDLADGSLSLSKVGAGMIVSDDCSGETPTSGVICFEY